MNKWVKILIGIAVLGTLAGIAYILWGPKVELPPEEPKIGFNEIHFVHEEEGRKVVEVFAESGDVDLKRQMGEMKNIRVIFYLKDGSEWLLTSPKGVASEKAETITLEAPIRVQGTEGATLEAEGTGIITVAEKTVLLEDSVKVVHQDTILTGDSMKVNFEQGNVTVLGKQAKLKRGGSR